MNLIPGINVRQGLAQVGSMVGLAPKKDYDVFDGVSVRGGDRTTVNNALVGKTATPTAVKKITDVFPPVDDGTGDGTGTGDGSSFLSAAAADPDAGLRQALRQEILARGGDIESVYASLFGDLDTLLKTRDAELESQYGDQFKKAGEQYAEAIPEIETSYAAIGADSSTDSADAKTGAKKGFDETTATIGKNKSADKAKLGQYGNEQRAKIAADKDTARRNVQRAGETTDVGALRTMRNDLEGNISNAGVTRATLGSEGQARKDLTTLTNDNGRFEGALNALDSIIKSSMSGSVKEAAVKAVTDNAGLSEEEKSKVQQQYGNVYAEQAAL